MELLLSSETHRVSGFKVWAGQGSTRHGNSLLLFVIVQLESGLSGSMSALHLVLTPYRFLNKSEGMLFQLYLRSRTSYTGSVPPPWLLSTASVNRSLGDKRN